MDSHRTDLEKQSVKTGSTIPAIFFFFLEYNAVLFITLDRPDKAEFLFIIHGLSSAYSLTFRVLTLFVKQVYQKTALRKV